MKYSRLLRLSAAGSRRAANWPLQRMNLEDFYSRLKTPVRSAETLDAYLRMPKAKQDELKDIGGYVFGSALTDSLGQNVTPLPAAGSGNSLNLLGWQARSGVWRLSSTSTLPCPTACGPERPC